MPRANRHYLSGYIWHITHRCHKKEFLLKFSRDRHRWLEWLFEAKKRYGIRILDYMVTSNHIHLLVVDGGHEVIPKTMQLIAGRTAQEYNLRKTRKGAFWEDRYHATAVQSNRHLMQCMTYIDLNMVRAGAVHHPSEWPFSGYHEIRNPRERYALLDYQGLLGMFNIKSIDELRGFYSGQIEHALESGHMVRESKWSDSLAVGDQPYVEEIKAKLGLRAEWRKPREIGEGYELREPLSPYDNDFTPKNGLLMPENTYFWNVYPQKNK